VSTRRTYLACGALLAAAFLLLVLPRLGLAPIERAEIYFLDAARTMAEGGDWLVPRYQGQAFYDKPALSYWLMAAAFRIFGVWLGPARAVSALAAAGCLALTMTLGTLLFSRRAGLAAAAVLATTFGFLSFARLAMSDMLLCFFVLAAATCGAAWLARPRARWWLGPALGAALGLAFLAKGPVAWMFAGCALAVFAWQNRATVREARFAQVFAAALVFALIGSSWFVALWWREGWEPLRHFFLQENLERFAGERYDAERGPFFYLLTYLAEGLPWSPFLAIALVALVREAPSEARRAAFGLCGWAALMLVPLSVSRGKIDYYLLPLYPAASLVIGRFLSSQWPSAAAAWVRAALAALGLLFAGFAFVPLRLPPAWQPQGPARFALAAAALAGAALLGVAAWRARRQAGWAILAPAAAAALVFAAFAQTTIPAFRGAQPQHAAVADIARELRYRKDARIVYCSDPARLERDLLFDARLAMTQRCDLLLAAASAQPRLFVLDPGEREFLAAVPALRDIAEYPVLPATIATLDGLIAGVAPSRIILAANYETDDPVAGRKWRRERKQSIRAEQLAAERPHRKRHRRKP
jgi:4-amino-4-deoxy-L-arabinose transferase-like glycosyltransferase